MPRLLVCAIAFVGGCFFEADYRGGSYACPDGRCPSGLTCVANACVAAAPDDAAIDTPDAREPALTCADPGVIASAGGTASGTTTARPAQLSSMCDGFVMNGREAVYRIDLAAGDQLLVTITSSARKAYVIAQCVTPAPACLGNTLATDGNPISVTPAAGPSFVIVDDENPAADGLYELTLTRN
jgi:hypothetical protein